MRDKKLIQMYITNMCNSKCKTCGIWKNKEREDLHISTIMKMICAFPDANYVIGGGEAILHNYINVILSVLNDKKINYTLLSNCIWTDKLMMLIEKHKVPAVTVSFDGLNHDEIRGSIGNSAKIFEFKDWCDYHNVRMKISYTYSKYNEGRFKEDMEFIKQKLRFNEIYFCLAQDMDLLMTAEADESFEARDFEQILDCDLINAKDKQHVRSMITGIRRCCTSQNNVHTVYSNGDIVRCQSFKSSDILGNVYRLSVKEIREVLNSVENSVCRFDSECNLLCQRRYD